jgi:hypothetical protein
VSDACAAYDDREDVNICTVSEAAEGVGKRDVCIADELRGVRDLIVCAVLPFSYVNLFNRGVSVTGVRVPEESWFEKADEVWFADGGSERGRQ